MGDIEKDYPRAIVNKEICRMDNYTDAIILNQSYNMTLMSPLTSIMLNPSKGDVTSNVASLQAVVDDVDQPVNTYARYWHGSTFLMRFLITFIGRYANVRLFFYYVSSLLMLLLLVLLLKYSLWEIMLSLTAGFLFLQGYVTQFSIQFFPVIIITICGSIMTIIYRNAPKKLCLLFFVVGSLTAFFDLLTTPVLTIGIPLLIYLSNSKQDSISNNCRMLVVFSTTWVCGYGFTWMTKWALATFFTPVNVFKEAFSMATYRIGGDVFYVSDYNRFDAILANVQKMPVLPIVIIVTAIAICACVAFNKKDYKISLLYFVISIIPYLWYCILANHSYMHCWFTYRIQIITLTSFLMAEMSLVDWPLLKRKMFSNN